MVTFETKTKSEILRHALNKLQSKTPITSIGPGSVARGLAETVVSELGDLYTIMDYNTSMGVISTAQGRALDLMGELYSVERKQIGDVATIDQTLGSFYFYVDTPHGSDITIPQGTTVRTDANNYIGQEYTYLTTSEVTIAAGRTRVFVGIRPDFSDSVFTAGANTITKHNAPQPEGAELKCTNPKVIAPQEGYESDDNYRRRIVKAVRTTAGGTVDALRFTGLSVPGVREVRIRNAPYGLGSVEALVVPEERLLAPRVLGDSIEELNRVRPAGVKLYVREPEYIPMDIEASVILGRTVSDGSGVPDRVRVGILRYLNKLLPGGEFVYNQLIQAMLEASDVIRDVRIRRLRVDNTEILRRNHKPKEDQQMVPGLIEVSIASADE